MNRRISLGLRMSLGVISIFLVFAVAFILFHQKREKNYKIENLNSRLQTYNQYMMESLADDAVITDSLVDDYVARHPMPSLRVTLIDTAGQVVYDNMRKDYAAMRSHKNRKEVQDALRTGRGYDIARLSNTLHKQYFYSATYCPKRHLLLRTALPYNNDLLRSLHADQHYLWFAILAVAVLAAILYRFISRLGDNITKLQLFATRAEHNETIDTAELGAFPDDELGEIAEKIIKIYKKLERTKEEQAILKRQLTQNIAHELKTPVASIQAYLETILQTPQMPDETREQFLQRSYAQTQRLSALLQDISTLNRMDDAPQMKEFQDVDLNAVVETIERETALLLEHRGMTLLNQLPQGIHVKGNPSLVYSIIRNLADNALAYAGEGTTVTLTARLDAAQWHFTFADNGVGIPPQHLPRIFERFYRADKGRSRKMGGTGLGLAIVKNAVLLHGGNITAQNLPTGGLQFQFNLPAA